MAEMQETKMKIKVDLACEKCRKKIKKVLCAIPQIQNQVYNEKDNEVLITVVSCNPEKVKKKIYCKGGKTVKCVEIIKPPPPKPKPTPTPPPNPTPTPPPKPTPTPPPKPTPPPCPKKCCEGHCGCPCRAGCKKCCEGHCGGSCSGCHKPPPCCKKRCEGNCGGSCSGCRKPDGPCYGCHECWVYCYNKPLCPSSCTYYICEEDPYACTIM